MIDLHLSAFAPRWRFLYAVRIDAYEKTRPKSKRQGFGALLGRVFHIKLSRSKGMLFDTG